MLNRQQLRQELRTQRRQLNTHLQQTAAAALTNRVCELPIFQTSVHIAGYIASDNEINPEAIFAHAWQLGKKCYLPLLKPGQQLCFVAYERSDKLHRNQFNILEPEFLPEKLIASDKLDLVLLPLVGFDLHGNRLGMGVGYYDRTFAFLQKTPRPTQPYLLGLAYEAQQVPNIPAESWDIRLDGVATEKKIHTLHHKENASK